MDEDMILPDDFEMDTPESTEPQDEIEMDSEDFNEPTEEDITPSDEPVEPTEPEVQEQEQPKLKLKFNHEEREISLEEATALAQKGMNYERAVERARQEARDAYIAEQNYQWNGKPITTEAEYKQALAEQELIEKYKDRDLPDEVIQEIMESRRDREERAKEKAAQEEQAKKDAQVNDFLEYFQRVNERAFDGSKDTIPQEVKAAVDKGESLKAAYMEYHNKQLLNQLKIAKQNEANQKKAPVGSVTAFGGTKTEPEDDFMAGFNSI